MKIAYSWLKDFIDLGENIEEISAALTQAGLEVEGIHVYEPIQGMLQGVVIGEVITCQPHPNADKLSLTTVAIAPDTIVPIVCGAPNVAAGQKVVVATVGATLYPEKGKPFTIKKAKIRGEESQGMICAEDELGLGTSHEGIMVLQTDLPNGTPAAHYFQLIADQVIEIGLTPNRGDAASHLGIARDLKAILNKPLKNWQKKVALPTQKNPIEIEIQDSAACPRYCGLYIKNVTVAASPEWLQNRLKSIGLNPINNIVDITNYVLHSIGQPLHAFDADTIAGKKIIVRKAKKDEKIITLDGVERKLSEQDLMICDVEKPMVMAGVFGGLNSGVSAATKNIFLESAYFEPTGVRKTSQHHGLKTDSSFRYERGTNPDILVEALHFAAQLIIEIAQGEIASEITDIYPQPILPKRIEMSYYNIDRLIGKEIERPIIHQILQNLDIQIENSDNYGHAGFEEGFTAIVPPYRTDVTREADVIEEILRIYGFNNIPLSPTLSTDFLASFPMLNTAKLQANIANILVGNGFNEIITNSLTAARYHRTVKSLPETENVIITNPLSEELNVMRQTLLFSGLEVVAYNLNRQQRDIKLFEFGKVYHKKAEATYSESKQLALFVAGHQHAETWQRKTEKVNFYTLSQYCHNILERLGITAQIENTTTDLLEYGVQFVIKEQVIGVAGLVSKAALKATGIKQPVFFAQLNWELLLKYYSKNTVKYQEIPKFPEVRRDLSMIIDKSVSFAQIQEIAQKTERKLLRQVNVFDVYESKEIGEGKKSCAVSFTLLDTTQTLTDKVIEKTMKRLMTAFEQEIQAVIRKQ